MRMIVIANPGAGQPEPVLRTLNDSVGAAGVDWQVVVTHGPGDGYKAALDAAKKGYDLIGAYGGDGTVTEVASALAVACGPPMVVLPGGTGNGLAEDLGIPATLAEAAALIAEDNYDVRKVDMGRTGDGWFILRLTMGFEASVVEAATRELKDRFGWLAYAFASLQTLANPPMAKYELEVDGVKSTAEGVACLIANSASTGVLGVKIAEGVDVSDGLLDLIVVEWADLPALAGSVAEAAAGQKPRDLTRWCGKKIRVASTPTQCVLADGEDAGSTPVEAEVAPGAISVVVPKPSEKTPA